MGMMMVQTLRKLEPATIRRNVPCRLLAAMRPDSAISDGDERSCPGQIDMWPSAATGYPAISRVE